MAYITGRAPHPFWKWFKFMLFILVASAVAGAYFYMNPDKWRQWTKGTPLEPPPSITQMYKWKNGSGQWQITDRPPPSGTEYKTLIFSSDTNVVPSLSPEEEQ